MKPDTIYALSSGALPSGVAVIRLSGPHSLETCRRLCGSIPLARHAALKMIRTRNDAILDQALVLVFPAPASFTGEDCVEFHLHGGVAVVRAVLQLLADEPGLRAAAAGEFTRRAFENGKLDLVEVEGLGDLVTAETEMQRRLAMQQARGGLSDLYDGWATRLTRARALIEAELDFADEDDVPGSVSDQVWADMTKLSRELSAHLALARTGERIRDGITVVLAGEPNAGKSSLLNRLAQRDVAIVTPVPGTTRDILSVDLDIHGFAVKLLDTAGLRAAEDAVEREGIRRAEAAIANADIVLLLAAPDTDYPDVSSQKNATMIRVATKSDLGPASLDADFTISTVTGDGLDALLAGLLDGLHLRQGAVNLAIPSRMRHVEHLRRCDAELHDALYGFDLELRAEHLRRAADALGRITGRVDVEDLLDIVFRDFCIGK